MTYDYLAPLAEHRHILSGQQAFATELYTVLRCDHPTPPASRHEALTIFKEVFDALEPTKVVGMGAQMFREGLQRGYSDAIDMFCSEFLHEGW